MNSSTLLVVVEVGKLGSEAVAAPDVVPVFVETLMPLIEGRMLNELQKKRTKNLK
jgi:hypothetical protein